jgi:hypothetical protein
MLNVVSEQQQEEKHGGQHHLVIVNGSDYHGEQVEFANRTANTLTNLQFFPSLRRFTMICLKEATSQGVIEALLSGRCYVAFNQSQIKDAAALTTRYLPDHGDTYEVAVSGLDLKCGDQVTMGAIEQGTGRAVSGVARIWGSGASIKIPLRSTLKPELGNRGWWMYINVANQVFTRVFICPFGEDKVAKADQEFYTPPDWASFTPLPKPSVTRPSAPLAPKPLGRPPVQVAPDQTEAQDSPGFLDQLLGLASLWGELKGLFHNNGGQNPGAPRPADNGQEVAQPMEQFRLPGR